MSNRIKFTSIVRFMASSLSSLADNLVEGLHNRKCKDFKSCLEYIKVNNKLLIFKCLNYNNNLKKIFQ